MTSTRHPAKFNNDILDAIAPWLGERDMVLDPFAGVGGITKLHATLPFLDIYCIELEHEWASQIDTTGGRVTVFEGDCLGVMATMVGNVRFDAVVTSPTYGNRMADSHTPSPSDTSKRNTYTHTLGRKLGKNNSGAMQWGGQYQTFHRKAWRLATMLVRLGGLFVLNCKDHVRGGEVMRVTDWHTQTLMSLGWELEGVEKIKTPGLREGANADTRVDYEWVKVFKQQSEES